MNKRIVKYIDHLTAKIPVVHYQYNTTEGVKTRPANHKRRIKRLFNKYVKANPNLKTYQERIALAFLVSKEYVISQVNPAIKRAVEKRKQQNEAMELIELQNKVEETDGEIFTKYEEVNESQT